MNSVSCEVFYIQKARNLSVYLAEIFQDKVQLIEQFGPIQYLPLKVWSMANLKGKDLQQVLDNILLEHQVSVNPTQRIKLLRYLDMFSQM